tara:strand:+ start:5923 stop:6363 length:441 start_codon:yes stop_codon:yes gene_type:complete
VKNNINQREHLQVTQKMHEELREELKSNDTNMVLQLKSFEKSVKSQFGEVESRFKMVDARFARIEARFNEIDARFDEMEARFQQIDARFDKLEGMMAKFYGEIAKMNAVNARTLALVEEQRAENKTIWDKQAQLELQVNTLLTPDV